MANLSVEGVGVRFGSFEALRDVSIEANSSEFVTLLGPSGCGKTTLLNAIAGFVRPSQGSIVVDGKEITHISPEKRNSAMCFQSYALFPHLSVEENIAFGPKQKGVTKAVITDRVENLLKKLGLFAHSKNLPNALSGGQQQRVALARALALAPQLVLFDEPLSNLDAKLRDQVRAEIKELQREFGFTAIYVTHDQTEALALSDRVYLLNGGIVEQSGTPEEIYFRPKTRFAAEFIGAANVHTGDVSNGILETPFGGLEIDTEAQKNITAIWRPEVVELGGKLQGQVTDAAFQGAYTDIFLTAGKETLRLQVPGGTNIQLGQMISFGVSKQHVTVVKDESDA